MGRRNVEVISVAFSLLVRRIDGLLFLGVLMDSRGGLLVRFALVDERADRDNAHREQHKRCYPAEVPGCISHRTSFAVYPRRCP